MHDCKIPRPSCCLNRLKIPNVERIAFGYAATAIRKLNAIKSRLRPDPTATDLTANVLLRKINGPTIGLLRDVNL